MKKMTELPERRLKKILSRDNHPASEYMGNLIIKLPDFLTETIVEIARVMGKNPNVLR